MPTNHVHVWRTAGEIGPNDDGTWTEASRCCDGCGTIERLGYVEPDDDHERLLDKADWIDMEERG